MFRLNLKRVLLFFAIKQSFLLTSFAQTYHHAETLDFLFQKLETMRPYAIPHIQKIEINEPEFPPTRGCENSSLTVLSRDITYLATSYNNYIRKSFSSQAISDELKDFLSLSTNQVKICKSRQLTTSALIETTTYVFSELNYSLQFKIFYK